MKLNLPNKTKATKRIALFANVSFEIEVPIDMDVNPNDIKVHMNKGWVSIPSAQKKTKKKSQIAIKKVEKKEVEDIW